MMKENSQTLKVTPAGRLMMIFLAAFNSGDPAKIRDFIADHYSEETLADHPVNELVTWHEQVYAQTGGMRIHKVFLSQEYYVVTVMVAKADEALYFNKMKVTHTQPYKIVQFFHEALDQAPS